MSLRQQFDDIMRQVQEIQQMEGEEEFIDAVVASTKIKDEIKPLEKKMCKLRKVVAKKERQQAKLMKKIKYER